MNHLSNKKGRKADGRATMKFSWQMITTAFAMHLIIQACNNDNATIQRYPDFFANTFAGTGIRDIVIEYPDGWRDSLLFDTLGRVVKEKRFGMRKQTAFNGCGFQLKKPQSRMCHLSTESNT